ncbi:MAG: hypothetical protein GY694_21070 [Gammaproteobacteria bacterium]|nr:hypothetical protein [Gammaproteobacteria bacterium]
MNSSFRIILLTLLSVFLLSSCSKSPDVRLTLCQDLMVLFLNPSENVVWEEHEALMRGYDDLEMKVAYSTEGSRSTIHKASCFYQYVQNQDEMGAEEFNTPTVAYSTYPRKMQLNGKAVEKIELANGVNSVMLKQGRQAIQNVKENVKEGVETINQEVKKQLDKID